MERVNANAGVNNPWSESKSTLCALLDVTGRRVVMSGK